MTKARLARLARLLVLAAAWSVLAALVSLGGGGVAAAFNHLPATAARPELTWAADGLAAPALDAATGRLQVLSDATDKLGISARAALTNLVSGDVAGLAKTVDAGTAQLAAIGSASDSLATSLAAVPYTTGHSELYLSAALRHRYDELLKTRTLTHGLEADWAVLSSRALNASTVPSLLALHDTQTAAAAKEGSAAHYTKALTLLNASDATIAKTRALRDHLGESADVTTLTTWLDLNAAYDRALRTLYKALLDSRGHVTSAVRKAFAGEQAARAALPRDTRAVVVIMASVAEGGLNQAVIDIEVARGSLLTALDLQQQLQSGGTPAP